VPLPRCSGSSTCRTGRERHARSTRRPGAAITRRDPRPGRRQRAPRGDGLPDRDPRRRAVPLPPRRRARRRPGPVDVPRARERRRDVRGLAPRSPIRGDGWRRTSPGCRRRDPRPAHRVVAALVLAGLPGPPLPRRGHGPAHRRGGCPDGGGRRPERRRDTAAGRRAGWLPAHPRAARRRWGDRGEPDEPRGRRLSGPCSACCRSGSRRRRGARAGRWHCSWGSRVLPVSGPEVLVDAGALARELAALAHRCCSTCGGRWATRTGATTTARGTCRARCTSTSPPSWPATRPTRPGAGTRCPRRRPAGRRRRWGVHADRPVVAYDATAGCRGAGLVAAALGGPPDVRLLDGGLTAWTAAGHPIESGEVSPPAPATWCRRRPPARPRRRRGRRAGPDRPPARRPRRRCATAARSSLSTRGPGTSRAPSAPPPPTTSTPTAGSATARPAGALRRAGGRLGAGRRVLTAPGSPRPTRSPPWPSPGFRPRSTPGRGPAWSNDPARPAAVGPSPGEGGQLAVASSAGGEPVEQPFDGHEPDEPRPLVAQHHGVCRSSGGREARAGPRRTAARPGSTRSGGCAAHRRSTRSTGRVVLVHDHDPLAAPSGPARVGHARPAGLLGQVEQRAVTRDRPPLPAQRDRGGVRGAHHGPGLPEPVALGQRHPQRHQAVELPMVSTPSAISQASIREANIPSASTTAAFVSSASMPRPGRGRPSRSPAAAA
jgi:thiosulfate/3-mercaptopyruvate sulfurtransferase